MILTGWSNSEKYGNFAPKLQVVDISEKGDVLFAVRTDDDMKRAYKYHIDKDDYGYKIGQKNGGARYVWRVGKSPVIREIPEGWVNVESEHRKEGAKKASQTKDAKKKLLDIKESITIDKFVELYAMSLALRYGYDKAEVISGVSAELSKHKDNELETWWSEKEKRLTIKPKYGGYDEVIIKKEGISCGEKYIPLEEVEKVVFDENKQ